MIGFTCLTRLHQYHRLFSSVKILFNATTYLKYQHLYPSPATTQGMPLSYPLLHNLHGPMYKYQPHSIPSRSQMEANSTVFL